MTIEPRLYRGMRDLLPSEMLAREEMLQNVRETFRRWGFTPLATPAIEFKEILVGKYGDMADRLIYSLKHKSGLALRYDLTVPLARAIAMYGQDLPTPFKRYQIQEVWRAERAQPRQGRFREFLQCDVDTVATDSLLADGEILALSMKLLEELSFPNAVTKVNHRAVLRGLIEVSGLPPESEMEICRIVDKLDKIGEENVRDELISAGSPGTSVSSLFDVILKSKEEKDPLDKILNKYGDNKRIRTGATDMMRVIDYAVDFGANPDNIEIELSLARGLDYYTGTIYESTIPEQPQIGSLTGGGRYDELIGMFTGTRIPAVGITIGIDRILAALDEAGRIERKITPTRVLVTVFGEDTLPSAIRLTRDLRNSGISTEVYLEDARIKNQFSYADKLDIPFVALIGEDEISRGTVSLKDMESGQQDEISIDELIRRVEG